VRIAPRAIAVKLFFPLRQIALTAVFLHQPVNVIHASAAALGTFDAEHVELALKVAEDEITPLGHDPDIITPVL
jgi:hypothetical protein